MTQSEILAAVLRWDAIPSPPKCKELARARHRREAELRRIAQEIRAEGATSDLERGILRWDEPTAYRETSLTLPAREAELRAIAAQEREQ